MDFSKASSIRKERIKDRIKLLEQQHLLRIAELDEQSRRSREEYQRSVEQIEQATKEAVRRIELHYKAKRDARLRKCSRENVDETMPVKYNSFSDGTLAKSLHSPSVQIDRVGSDSQWPSINIVQPNVFPYTATENDDDDQYIISGPEMLDEIGEIENFRSKEESTVQTVMHFTVGVKSSFQSIIQCESCSVDKIHTLSKSSSSRSMGQSEMVNIASPLCITQERAESRYGHAQADLIYQYHYYLPEDKILHTRKCNKNNTHIRPALTVYKSRKYAAIKMSSVITMGNRFIQALMINIFAGVEVMDYASYYGRCQLRRTGCMGFDPGGLDVTAQRRSTMVMQEMLGYANYLLKSLQCVCIRICGTCMMIKYKAFGFEYDLSSQWKCDETQQNERERDPVTTVPITRAMVGYSELHHRLKMQYSSVYTVHDFVNTTVLCANILRLLIWIGKLSIDIVAFSDLINGYSGHSKFEDVSVKPAVGARSIEGSARIGTFVLVN